MPTGWLAAPDEAVLNHVTTILNSTQRSGVVLAGPDGVGKTLVARTAAQRFVTQQPTTVVRWVAGTAPERNLPFGAFGRQLDITDIAETDRPAALLRAAHESLSGGGEQLFVVDDAHDLDHLSATLLYQLALSRLPRLVVTVCSGAELPDAVAALWADDLLSRIEVEPLDRPGTATLLESAVGAPLDAAATDEVFYRSKGNPLYLQHLVGDGGLVHADGGWRCRDKDRLTLSGLIDVYLRGLPTPVRTVLDYLAVAEPLRRSDLAALAGQHAVDEAETAAAVTCGTGGDKTLVRATHPLYTGRIRATLAPANVRRLRTSLVGQLQTRQSEHFGDQLRLTALAAGSDAPGVVADMVTGAQQALRLGELVLAEQLAGAALEQSGELAARMPLAYALAWQGRGREAGALLAEVDPDQLSETELIAWTLPRAANQFWMLSEPERATAFLQTMRNRLSAPTALATVDALAATFAMNSGTPLRALRVAGEVLASPHAIDVAVGWAASAAALCSARIGRFDDVEALAGRALAADHPGLLRFTSGFGRITTLLMLGQPDEARVVAQRYTDFGELQQPGRAIGETLLGYVAIAQGDFEVAVALLRRAVDPLARTGYSWGPLSLTLLAQALGQQGEQLEAAKVFSRAQSRHGLKSTLFGPELELAKAWSKAARGDTAGAIDAARAAVQAAERGGQSAIALRTLHDAARLGDTRAVYRAERLSVEVDCVLGRLALAHARALAANDSTALAEVAVDLADHGLHAAAADAAAQAQRALS